MFHMKHGSLHAVQDDQPVTLLPTSEDAMINLAQARTLLRQAMLTQGPDFRYIKADAVTSCYYEPIPRASHDPRGMAILDPNTDPRTITGCLVGTALTLAGKDFHLRSSNNDRFVAENIATLATNHTSRDAREYLYTAQTAQDNGQTWGDAYRAAEEWAKEWADERVIELDD